MLDAVSMAGMNCLRLMNDTTAGTVLTPVHHFISVCKAEETGSHSTPTCTIHVLSAELIKYA